MKPESQANNLERPHRIECDVLFGDSVSAVQRRYRLDWANAKKLMDDLKPLATTKKSLQVACNEWAEDHTHLQNLCREVGYSEDEVEGNSYGVPGIKELADMLRAKIPPNAKLRDGGTKTENKD